MKKESMLLILLSLATSSTAVLAQITKPVLTPGPKTELQGANGPWTCMTTCGGPKEEDRKVAAALNNSEKNCSGKGKLLSEAIDDLKTKLGRDSSHDTTHAPNYECKGCTKEDLENAVCKDKNNTNHSYKELAKTRLHPESQTQSQ